MPPAAATSPVTSWIRAAAVPLSPGSLCRAVGDDALVVGVGRPTHGSHEASTLTHSVAQELVASHGFRTVAIEERAWLDAPASLRLYGPQAGTMTGGPLAIWFDALAYLPSTTPTHL